MHLMGLQTRARAQLPGPAHDAGEWHEPHGHHVVVEAVPAGPDESPIRVSSHGTMRESAPGNLMEVIGAALQPA